MNRKPQTVLKVKLAREKKKSSDNVSINLRTFSITITLRYIAVHIFNDVHKSEITINVFNMQSKPNEKLPNHFYKLFQEFIEGDDFAITQNISKMWFEIFYVHDKNVLVSKSLKGLLKFQCHKIYWISLSTIILRSKKFLVLFTFWFKRSDWKCILP